MKSHQGKEDKMNIVVLDAGNAIIKAKNASSEIKFPHAIKPLTDTEWDSGTRGGGGASEDYIRVNGTAYLVGLSAERKTLRKSTFKTGAARYTRGYYGVFLAVTLSRLYSKSMRDIFLFGSHAPGDWMYRDALMKSALGEWHVEVCGKERTFAVEEADTFDEPNGGASNMLYTDDGTRVQNLPMKKGTTLMIDIGGHTTDFMVIHPGGEIDNDESESLPGVGINAVLDALRDALKRRYPSVFQDLNVFSMSKLRDALRTGQYDAGGYGMLDCVDMADEASAPLLNSIGNKYQQYGGTAQFNFIGLTGGGGGSQEQRLRRLLEHPRILLADKPEQIELANVRGGWKLFKVYQAAGIL